MQTHEEEPWQAEALGDGAQPLTLRVVDLKQWFACPRLVYYGQQLPGLRPMTHAMEDGQAAHEALRQPLSWQSRSLAGLPDGTRHLDVPLYAPDLHLSGRVDLVIEQEAQLIPVDLKDSDNLKHRALQMQIVGYGLLLEHLWERPVPYGLLYSLPGRYTVEVRLTPARRRAAHAAIEAMLDVVQRGAMPAPPAHRRLCLSCEFRRFCNDLF